MRKVKEGNVIYLVKKDADSMDLRCSNCNVVKNEADLKSIVDENTGFKKYECECGCSSFTPQEDFSIYDEYLI